MNIALRNAFEEPLLVFMQRFAIWGHDLHEGCGRR